VIPISQYKAQAGEPDLFQYIERRMAGKCPWGRSVFSAARYSVTDRHTAVMTLSGWRRDPDLVPTIVATLLPEDADPVVAFLNSSASERVANHRPAALVADLLVRAFTPVDGEPPGTGARRQIVFAWLWEFMRTRE
jgi:hypothetical protein